MKIKLSESKLKQIIYESVKSILKESNECPNCGNETHGDKCEHCGSVLKESKETNEVVLKSVETEYFKTSKTGNPIFKLCGETVDGEEFCGYTSPNASCAYECRGLSTERLIRTYKLLNVKYHFTPKGFKSIDFLDFVDKY